MLANSIQLMLLGIELPLHIRQRLFNRGLLKSRKPITLKKLNPKP
jgi:hypothetical protein